MATKYTILETEHTEESAPYSSKKKAVTDADKLAAQYPGTTFAVCTAAGKIVHRSLSVEETTTDEGVDPDPVDDVPETQVDSDFAPETEDGQAPGVDDAEDPFNATLTEVLSEDAAPDQNAAEDGNEDEGAKNHPAPTMPDAAPEGAELELCAANTNAKRMHYRTIGSQVSECESAQTTRRANQHQINTASLCPACIKLRGGRVVDERPAGTGRGTRKSPKRLIMNAGEIRDIVAHLKQGIPFPMTLADGTSIDVVAGDPATGELDEDKADMQSITIVQG